MSSVSLPNFRGRRAIVVHPSDRATAMLADQLEKFGLLVEVAWPVDRLACSNIDIVLFDVDQGYDAMFAWKPGESPVPLVALLGSEAPGRIEWALSQLPAAYLAKPIRSVGTFSALAIAFHTFALRRRKEEQIRQLMIQVDARRFVVGATRLLMQTLHVSESGAYKLLRDESMHRRISVEEFSRLVVERKLLPQLEEGHEVGRTKKRRAHQLD